MAATYTVKQVAEILGYSTNSIYTFLKEKRIKGVRVGRGRFRIAQPELDRLLHVSKNTPLIAQSVITPQENIATTNLSGHSGVSDIVGQSVENVLSIGRMRLGIPNIFVWFIGISAIIAGLSMYLYNQSFSGTSVGSMMPILNAMRTLFIGGGLGILLANIFGGLNNPWKKVFTGLLIIAGCVLSFFLWRTGDVDGLSIYGTLVIVLTVTTIFTVGGLASFSLYLTFLAISAAVVPLFGQNDPHVIGFLGLLHLTNWEALLLFAAAGLIFSILLWWGYYSKRSIYWVCTWVASAAYFALALWYADGQYWSRSFFMVMVGITSLFAAPWESIHSTTNRKEQLTGLAVYGIIFGALVVGIIIVGVMQVNVLETLKQENTNKITYARTSVEATLSSVESTLESVATNTDFVNAVSSRDTGELNDVSRVIFESNHNIRRLIVLDKVGNGVNLYPVGTFDQSNLAFRDYFIQARDTNAPFVSDLFTSLADQTHRSSVVISVPLTNRDHSFAGVLAASLDLLAISARLQQIPVPTRDEYVSIVDSHGIRIVHPETALIGTPADKNDPQLLGITGHRGIANAVTFNGQQALVVYDTVDDVHWGIAIKTPLSSVYKLTNTTTLIVMGAVLVLVILATFFLQGVHMHLTFKRREEEHSP